MSRISLAATASYLPERWMTAAEVGERSSIPEQVIVEKFGLRGKHIAAADEHVSDLSVRAAERLARETRDGAARDTGPMRQVVTGREAMPTTDPNLAAVEEALRLALGTKVTVRKSSSVGRLEIEFYSEEQLEGIVERILGNGRSHG